MPHAVAALFHPLRIAVLTAAFMLCGASARAQNMNLPPGFILEEFGDTWFEVIGVTFAEDGTLFAWERRGLLAMFRNSQWYHILNISDEVGQWRDHGLLSVALHPDFLNNGYIYLLYVVDRHHLLYFGSPQYNPNDNDYHSATIGRITRYTLDASNNFQTVVPNSRLVLLGESKTTGIPILHESHGVGTLLFGTDGTLLATCGDGASYDGLDMGGNQGGAYGNQALADGIIKPKENVGVFRSQLVDSHSGKIMRLDPATGNGVPSNPYYDAAQPRAPKSRVWALGLRNPCRMTLRPDTGSHNPADGNPGVIYLGDVGMDSWEDFSICTAPRQNFGWPSYEGYSLHPSYSVANIANQDASNPLFGQGGCTQQYFYFRNLLIEDTLNPNPSFPNPCNPAQQIPASIPKFTHRRPELDWGHNGPARTGIFSNGQPAVINVGAPGSPVSGAQFVGNTSMAGTWYRPPTVGPGFPVQYHNKYFHVDYSREWIKVITLDGNDKASSIQHFLDAGVGGGARIITLTQDPVKGDLYFARWEKVYRIRYAPGNYPPVAVASANVTYGPSPLTVQFTGSGSSDPDQQPLQFLWNFGDGSTSTQANPSHTFIAPNSSPIAFNVTLTVTDPGNLSSQASLIISVNNTPPTVSIVSPVAGSTYPMGVQSIYWLRANIADAEHSPGQISCQWQTILHHNNHTHEEPIDPNCVTSTVISPVGCEGGATYYYRVTLTVTDGAGLSASDERILNPNCTGNVPPLAANDSATAMQGQSVQVPALSNDSDPNGTLNPATAVIIHVPARGSVSVNPATGVMTYTNNGQSAQDDSFTYTVNDNAGGTSNLATVTIDVTAASPGDTNGDGIVNVIDLLAVINAWGACPLPPQPCPADVAPPGGDGVVNVQDLLMVIANWG
jgi:PKD repeat protein/glucose/arabinose dehydrogenase